MDKDYYNIMDDKFENITGVLPYYILTLPIEFNDFKKQPNYLEENKELILDLCVSNKNILNFEDDIFYDASLLQTEFLKWCCTR